MMNLADLRKYRALAFDMDGTLVPSEPFHIQALTLALKEMLGYTFSWDDGLEYNGITSKEMAGRILKRLNRHDVDPAAISRRKQEIVLDIFRGDLYPHVREFFEAAVGLNAWKLALASNSIPRFIDLCLKGGGIYSCFDVVLSCEDVENTKPSPEIYLKTAERLRLPPADILVFEDSTPGLVAARDGGFDSILVLNPGNIIPSDMPSAQPMATWGQLAAMLMPDH